MPELPESLRAQDAITRKRKDAPGAPTEERGKRRKDNKASAKAVAPVKGGKTKASGKPIKPLKSAKRNAPPPISDDDIVSDEADGIDDPDVMEDPLDGVNVTALDALGSPSDSEDLEDDEFAGCLYG